MHHAWQWITDRSNWDAGWVTAFATVVAAVGAVVAAIWTINISRRLVGIEKAREKRELEAHEIAVLEHQARWLPSLSIGSNWILEPVPGEPDHYRLEVFVDNGGPADAASVIVVASSDDGVFGSAQLREPIAPHTRGLVIIEVPQKLSESGYYHLGHNWIGLTALDRTTRVTATERVLLQSVTRPDPWPERTADVEPTQQGQA